MEKAQNNLASGSVEISNQGKGFGGIQVRHVRMRREASTMSARAAQKLKRT